MKSNASESFDQSAAKKQKTEAQSNTATSALAPAATPTIDHGEATPKAPTNKALVQDSSPSLEFIAENTINSANLTPTDQLNAYSPSRDEEKEVPLIAVTEKAKIFRPTFTYDGRLMTVEDSALVSVNIA